MSEKYRTDWILFKELGQMTKPSFQRGFKWSQKKQNELIETIRNGLPFGMFLLDEKSKGNYNILDGQQRYTTIRNYKNDMSAFISNENIKSDDLIKELSSIDDIKSAVKKCKTKLEKVNYKSIFKDCKCDVKKSMKAIRAEINEILTAEIDLKEKTRNKIEDCIENWINATLKRIDVDNIKIPVIILTNAIEDKADVFIKLNQTGLKLNKYELLAAQWNDKDSKLCCKDKDIIKAVLDRYKNVNDKEIEFDEFDEDDIKNTENGHKNITAFEYLYGLSKIIDKKIESILNNKKTDESAYGFIIVSEIFDKAFKDIDEGIKAKLDDFHIYEGISSPANITLIPPLDNIKKKKLTYYEYDKEMSQGSLYKFSDADLSKLLYPKHAEIKWVEGTKDINEAEFQTFRDNRTNMLIDKITESLSENN